MSDGFSENEGTRRERIKNNYLLLVVGSLKCVKNVEVLSPLWTWTHMSIATHIIKQGKRILSRLVTVTLNQVDAWIMEAAVASTHVREQLLIQEANLLLCTSAVITSLHLSPDVARKYFTCVMTWIPSSLFPFANSLWHGRGIPRSKLRVKFWFGIDQMRRLGCKERKEEKKKRRWCFCINMNGNASALYWSWKNWALNLVKQSNPWKLCFEFL